MNEETQKSEAIQMPHTWERALEQWDSGASVPAFTVESEGASQEILWGVAFEILRGAENPSQLDGLTSREIDTVKSIAHVAKLVSWPQMISSHVAAQSPARTIRNAQSKS